jgi:hypothetical protein
MAEAKRVPHTTAHILAVFADELTAVGFSEDRITRLLAVALQHELRSAELMLVNLDG